VIDEVVGQKYRIVRLLGAGGMGSVYEAVEVSGGRRVALKVITAESARNETAMGRFAREAKAATTIDTPHIVKVLDAGVDEAKNLPYLVMEYLDGEDVHQLIKRLGPLAPELALRITAQACLGLMKAHEARIIHRDIKPANFFLAREGGARIVKLLDFGIAKIAHDPADSKAETAGLTRTGSMLGSPLYMSPEQARGVKDLDRRADIWSLGVVLYQALTGRTPHRDTDALGELIIAICTEDPPTIQELAPWVPPEIVAVAGGAMRVEPGERYQTAGAMLEAMKPLLPGGWAIDDSMFTPLAEAERARVAPPLVSQPVMHGGRTASGGRTGADAGPSSSLEGFGTTVGSGGALVPGGAAAPPRGSRPGVIAAAAVVALLLSGVGIYEIGSRAPAPAATAAPAPPAPPPPPPPAKKLSVKLVVFPDGAAVEVDGKPATPADGTVEIEGEPGSVHKVKLSKDGEAMTGEVVVTDSGARPAKMTLEIPAAKKPSPPPVNTGKLVAPRPTVDSAPPLRPR
jgi:serine/threonine-protein kinase